MVMSFQLETEKKIISEVTHLIEKDMLRHVCRIQKSPGSPISPGENHRELSGPYLPIHFFICVCV